MKLSNRISALPFSAIRKLTPYAEAAKKAGKKIYHLNIGAPDVQTPKIFFDAIKEADLDVLTYAPSKGLPELIEATSKYYKDWGINYEPEDIVITTGGSESLLFAILAIADEGDEILTCEPFYANYSSFSYETGTKINTFSTSVQDGFHMPAKEEIEKAITPKTKAILLSNPSNPTGAVYREDELRMLADLAKKHDLYILSDEVYREFTFDGAEFKSFATFEDISDRVIVLDSISKRFSACGARIGTIASKNKEIMQACVKLVTGRLAAPTLEQIGAAALYGIDPSYYKEVQKEYERRRDCIYEELNKIEGVTTYKPGGAFYIMPEIPVDDAEKFAIWMLEEFEVDGETVMMAPAGGFYQNTEKGKSQIRLAFVLNCDDLRRACHILKLGIEAYNKR